MTPRTLLIALGAAILVVACSDSTGPPMRASPSEEALVPAGALHHLYWKAPKTPRQFTIVREPLDRRSAEGLRTHPRAPAGKSLVLETYTASFWAVSGEHRFIQINYVGSENDYGNGDGVLPFLRLDIPPLALKRLPDGSRIAWGDSVLITVSVDPLRIAVSLEPSGLRFSERDPATLQIWYTGAGGDLNSDGVVDEQDAYIEQKLLSLWYQKKPGWPWRKITTQHSMADKWFVAELKHFSGYAVSY